MLLYGDLTDASSILNIIKKVSPNEIYNLVMAISCALFEVPEYSADVNAIGNFENFRGN